MKKGLLSAIAATAVLSLAAPAAATVYNLNVFETGFTPPVGTVTVTGEGTNVLSFDVLLTNSSFFQLTGNGGLHDSFWFDLVGSPSIAYNITAPNADGVAPGGDYPVGGLFTGANFSNNAFGQGFLKNYDYAVQVQDTAGGVQYYGGHLTFTATAAAGTQLNLAARDVNGAQVFLGADVRQCLTESCVTGPVGGTLGGGGGVPEPSAWALMILGFGGVGVATRARRRSAPTTA